MCVVVLHTAWTSIDRSKYSNNTLYYLAGSNSVNVFLGLGLPWVISSLYAASKNVKFTVAKGNLVSSVVIFTICGTLCIFLLLIRRKVSFFSCMFDSIVWYMCSQILIKSSRETPFCAVA